MNRLVSGIIAAGTLGTVMLTMGAANPSMVTDKSPISQFGILTAKQLLSNTNSHVIVSGNISGHSFGTFTKTTFLSNYSAIKAELDKNVLSSKDIDVLKGIPTSITDVVSIKSGNSVGDPTVSDTVTEKDFLGIPVWKYTVTQSFDYDGYEVTYVGAAQNDTAPYYPGWSLSNVSNNDSNPIPYTIVHSNNEAVFTYTPYDLTTIETQDCTIHFTFYGDGSWSSSYSVTTS